MGISRFCIALSLCITVAFAQRNTSLIPVPYKPYTTPECHKGAYKGSPSAESNLPACKQYSCSSCCNSSLAVELAITPIQQVGVLNFKQCNKTLSQACSMETTVIECFFQCSPNLFPWIGQNKVLRNVPICASFCDYWFETCKGDMTCVDSPKGNWQTGLRYGFDSYGNPVDPCRYNSPCRNYSTVYSNGENLCNNIWGNLFTYTKDKDKCLDPTNPEKNVEFVKSLGDYEPEECVSEASVDYVDAGLIVGIVFGVLAGIFIIVAAVVFFLRRNKEKDSGPAKTKEVAPPEEMATLRSTQPTADNPPTAKEDNSDVEAEKALD